MTVSILSVLVSFFSS